VHVNLNLKPTLSVLMHLRRPKLDLTLTILSLDPDPQAGRGSGMMTETPTNSGTNQTPQNQGADMGPATPLSDSTRTTECPFDVGYGQIKAKRDPKPVSRYKSHGSRLLGPQQTKPPYNTEIVGIYEEEKVKLIFFFFPALKF